MCRAVCCLYRCQDDQIAAAIAAGADVAGGEELIAKVINTYRHSMMQYSLLRSDICQFIVRHGPVSNLHAHVVVGWVLVYRPTAKSLSITTPLTLFGN